LAGLQAYPYQVEAGSSFTHNKTRNPVVRPDYPCWGEATTLDVMNQITSSILSQFLSGTPDSSFLRDELLSEVFSATAVRVPSSPAVEFDGQIVTYGELDAAANGVARSLRERGIGRGAFVGLWMSRSFDLHVALLGILKAGAAYLPFDCEVPAERVAACLTDCAAQAIIVDDVTKVRAGNQSVNILPFTDLSGTPSTDVIDLRALGLSPADPAYVIYTSGSTGLPKGVVISHRNICHYLRAANSIYGVNADDVVFQGASVAFDLSLEEIFLPYLVGARMWIAGQHVLQEFDRLADVLTGAGITVLSVVPTLLAMLPADVPSLRLVILGGEACPPSLTARWCRPGRRIFNSYGPTESTVVATMAEVRADEPVTIGRPIPNYTCYVVDEDLRLVPSGVEGELLIGGPGVANGYLNRPELTAQKFIANPFRADRSDPILYRSGDAVSVDDSGCLVFHGRIDDQVKIRGFRVELGEIEARLSNHPAIAQAAVVLRQDNGTDRLVAFLVAQPDTELDRAALRETLLTQLPSYMVPSHFEQVATLPRLVSGKVNRKALQQAVLTAVLTTEQEQPQTPVEAILLAAAQRVFPSQVIPFDADFFVDLGGHSLIAARFVSAARETPLLASLALQDVYTSRTLRAIAARYQTAQAGKENQQAPSLAFDPPPLLRRFLCGLAQAAVLPIILSLTTAPWLGVFVAYQFFSGDEHNFLSETTALLVTYGVINSVTILLAIAGKWLAIGRTRPGRYPLWGVYYFRWWLAHRFVALLHLQWFQGTPIMRVFLRALGTRVGSDVFFVNAIEAGAVDLVSIGNGAVIGGKTQFANAEVVGDQLIITPIVVGADAVVGSSCVIGRDVTIGEGAELADITSLPPGTQVGAWERWEGSPGRRIGHVDAASLPVRSQASAMRKAMIATTYAVMLFLLPPITLVPVIPAFYLFDSLSDVLSEFLSVSYLYFLPVLAWPAAMVLIMVTVLMIAAVRWGVLPRVKAGTYSVYSGFYLRKWIVALATELTLETLSSLYATVYMCSWYRLMGAKIGKDTEISTNLAGRYDVTEIGDKCFIADDVMLGDEDVRRGWIFLKPVKTGSRVFVGNSAVVPPGSDIPDGILIGVNSCTPACNADMTEGDIWFGSPPIKLPVRQRFDDVAANWTFEPSRWRRFGRAIFEAFRVSLPTMLFITFGSLAVEILASSILDRNYGTVLMLFMAASVLISSGLGLAAAAVKWGLMGVYRPTAKPMWSWWALRTEAVAVTYTGMAGRVVLDHLRGTPLLPWVLRIFGCKFGRGVFMNTTDITEFDCINVGDFCAINEASALQTHLYEDRVMKVGKIVLGTGVTIGSGSTVLYDTHVGDFARIGLLTIIMKGEEIPANSEWHGAPAQPTPAS
jgi:non-ribosomal peptide synthetase-like protein